MNKMIMFLIFIICCLRVQAIEWTLVPSQSLFDVETTMIQKIYIEPIPLYHYRICSDNSRVFKIFRDEEPFGYIKKSYSDYKVRRI